MRRVSLADLAGLALAAFLLTFTWQQQPGTLLADAGTGVHLRTGDWMLQHRTIPVTDPFSFSKPDAPWFAWEWLCDVLFAGLNAWGSLGAISVWATILLAGVAIWLLRDAARVTGNALAAIVLFHVFVASSSHHFLARPHLWTMAGFALMVAWVLADLETAGKRVWLFVPLCAVWANLHAGFVALPVTLGALSFGLLVDRNRAWRRYAALAAACAAAALANPYGWSLYAHIAEFLKSGWIRQYVQEFQAPVWGSWTGAYAALLIVMAAVVVVSEARGGRWRWVPVLLLWGVAATRSSRHVPLLAIVVLPLSARWLAAWGPYQRWRGTLPEIGKEYAPGMARGGAVAMGALLALLGATAASGTWAEFPSWKYPVATNAKIAAGIEGTRLLTLDSWADYLIYRNWPRQKVFFDGRTDFYGEQLSLDYRRMVQAEPGWEALLDRYGIDGVLAPRSSQLAHALTNDPKWRVAHADAEAVWFARGARGGA